MDSINRGVNKEAWFADFDTGKVTRIDGFDCSYLCYVESFADGGFVAGGHDGFAAFNALGKEEWTREGDYNAQTPDVLPEDPKDVAITTTGEVAALLNNKGAIYRADREGRYLGTIDLAKTWGRKPNYPTGIGADADGGFVITDFNGSPPLVRMKRDGTVRSAFQPKYPDGRRISPGEEVRADSDGRLWLTDRYALLRLDDAGIVDRVIGNPPDPDQLGAIAGVEIDRAGRIYAVDRRTGSVHVFDPRGAWLRVCRPAPEDLDGHCIGAQLTVSDEGEVYFNLYEARAERTGEFLRYTPDGNRLRIERLDLDRISQEWYLQPRTGHRWVVGYDDVFLVDRSGRVLKTIERCPGGKWLRDLGHAAVAADGSIVVLARGAVNIFAAGGEPLRSIPLPGPFEGKFARIAYDGHRIAILEDETILLLDAAGRPQCCFSPVDPGGQAPSGNPYFSPDGRELLLFNDVMEITRYELP